MAIYQELQLSPDVPLSLFLRLFLLDEDGSLRLTRVVNGLTTLTTLTPNLDGTTTVRQELVDEQGG